MKRPLKITLWVLLGLTALAALKTAWVFLEMGGDIPEMMDSNDGWYERVVDIQPTSGKIWYSSVGWRSTENYLRLHLSQADFRKNFEPGSALKESDKPALGSTPIWWNPDTKGQYFFSSSKFEEVLFIYDPKRKLLYGKISFW
jgi:hypothetical protein